METETLVVVIVGLLVVFCVLSCLAIMVGLLRRCDEWLVARKTPKLAEDKTTAAIETTDQEVDPLTLALITAAVSAVLRQRFAIRQIHRLPATRDESSSWAKQGRVDIHSSHVIVRKA